MDLATFGIVIDPRQAKSGGDETKAVLKSIEVTAKETQAGVVAAFEDTANKRKITIRDSAAVAKSAEGEVTATVQAEAGRRNEIDAATAAANRERTAERLAATQRALEQMQMAEIQAARTASEAAIGAANATKESTLAAIEAARAGRQAEAREALEAAQSSTTAMKEALAQQAAASRDLTAQQRELLREHTGDSKAAAKEAMEAQKIAIAEVAAADKAAQAAIRAEQKETVTAEKQAARDRVTAQKQVAAEARTAAKAANESETGWRKLERAGIQALATLGLVAPGANTALVGVQALQSGLELTALGFVGLTAVLSGFILVAAGLAGAALLIKGISEAAKMEPLENQLANAAGSFKGIEERMESIKAIQHDAGGLFKIEALVTANRELQLFTNGALASEDSLRMIADAAVVVQKPIDQVAAAVGKLYGAIQDKNPVDRYVKQLINMRLINQDVANSLVNMQREGASPDEVWKKAEGALRGYGGAMDQYGRTMEGTIGKIKVDIDHALEAFARPLLPLIEPALKAIEERLKNFSPQAQNIGYMVAGAVRTANWDEVWEYVGLQFDEAMNKAGTAAADWLINEFKRVPSDFAKEFKKEWENEIRPLLKEAGQLVGQVAAVPLQAGIPGTLRLEAGQNADRRNNMRIGGTTGYGPAGPRAPLQRIESITPGDVYGPEITDNQRRILQLESAWIAAGKAVVEAEREAGKLPSGPQGTGEPVELEKKTNKGFTHDDATIMADFVAQLNDLTYKMQQGTVSRPEFERRRDQLQQTTVGSLGDPGHANDIYSNPAAADKVWQDILGKWRVFQEERARLAEAADQRIKAGTASVSESMMAGLNKVSDQWGNLQQHISAGVGAIAQSIDNNLTGAITALITGTKDAKTAFRDMAVAIINDIVKTCVQLLIELAIRQAIKAVSGYATGGSVGATGSLDGQALNVDGGEAGDMTAFPSGTGSAGGFSGGSGGGGISPELPSGGLETGGTGGSLDLNDHPFASGGHVWGGNGGIDDIPARLTRGEYVIPKDAAEHYGTAFLDAVRGQKVKVRGFAAGGPVPGPVTAAGRGGGTGDNYHVNINIDGAGNRTGGKGGSNKSDSEDETERLKQLGQLIEAGARAVIVKERRNGGLLNNGGKH